MRSSGGGSGSVATSSADSPASAASSATIGRLFQIRRQTGSAGQEQLWRVFDAVRIEDNKDCSLFIFDKRTADKLHKPKRKETVSEILRREIRYLERFRHPKLLQIWHSIEESGDSLTFATEPVWGSLANFLGYCDRVPAVPQEVKDGFTDELEIKQGIYQINEALKYLHSTQRVIHGNLSPGSIIVTKRGCWKLSGLGFVEKAPDTHDAYNYTQWSAKVSKMAQPDLDYMAPDLQLHGRATQGCDMFSFGLVIHAVFNGGVSLLESQRSGSNYQRRAAELPSQLPQALSQLPHELADIVEKLLDSDARHRPTAQMFAKIKYFQDPLLLALEGLSTCEAKTMDQKREFFGLLMQTMMREQFPKPIMFKRVAPLLVENLNQAAELTPYVVPCLLQAVAQSTRAEFSAHLCEPVLGLLRRPKTAQTSLVIVEHTDVLVEKLSDEDIRGDLLPLLFATLESNSASGQEAALSSFSVLQDHIDEQTLRRLILPKAKAVFCRSSSLLPMQVNALACIDQLIDRLDKMIILEEILPFLLEINFTDTDIYMAVIHIYKHMLSDKRFGLTFSLIATKVLPHLIPYTVNPNLRRDDFRVVMETLNVMWMRLENGRSAQMKLTEFNGSDSMEDSGSHARPPLITMQQPSFESELTLMVDEDDKFQHRRRSSSGLQRKERLKKLNETAAGIQSNPDLSDIPLSKRIEAISKILEASRAGDISNAISRYRDSRRRSSLTRQTSDDNVTRRPSHGTLSPSRLCDSGEDPVVKMGKAGSSPSFSLRASPRKGSATDVFCVSGPPSSGSSSVAGGSDTAAAATSRIKSGSLGAHPDCLRVHPPPQHSLSVPVIVTTSADTDEQSASAAAAAAAIPEAPSDDYRGRQRLLHLHQHHQHHQQQHQQQQQHRWQSRGQAPPRLMITHHFEQHQPRSRSLDVTPYPPSIGESMSSAGRRHLYSSSEDANRSFTLSLPTAVQPRRHSVNTAPPAAAGPAGPSSASLMSGACSFGVGSSGGSLAAGAEASFNSPPSSKQSSRRPSTYNLMPDRAGDSGATRRSSFNALSDTVMNFFSRNG